MWLDFVVELPVVRPTYKMGWMFGNSIVVAVQFGAASGAEIMHISFHICSLNLMKCIKMEV